MDMRHLETCKLVLTSGRTQTVKISGFYDLQAVLNVEFHYGDIHPEDEQELEAWQTERVRRWGRRVK